MYFVQVNILNLVTSPRGLTIHSEDDTYSNPRILWIIVMQF